MSRVSLLNPHATKIDTLTTANVFSTAAYAQVGGDDRPRVASAVAAAVAAMTATGKNQTVLIHAPLTFTTGVTKAALGTTADTENSAHTRLGVPIPVALPHILSIVFAPGAKITLSAACKNAFYIDKLADYNVFQNVDFYDAWVDGAGLGLSDNDAHILIGNSLSAYPLAPLRYLSFQDINFFGHTRFTNFAWDASGAAGGGQTGIVFRGEHNAMLEATQTFSKNIYLEYGDQEGGGGVLCVASSGSIRYRPGGCNHYHDNIVVDRYRNVMPGTPTAFVNHVHTTVYIAGHGFGDRCYIGPGYSEGIGDSAIEIGAMQQVDIVAPRSKNPWFMGVFLRQIHTPIDVNSQKITIRGLRCEVTTALTATTGAWFAPIGLLVDDNITTLTSTATGGTFTLTIAANDGSGNTWGTTAAIAWNATAATIAAALQAVVAWATTTATGGPLGTAPVTVTMAGADGTMPLSVNSSLTGGTLTATLAPSNASFGTITIEDAICKIDGLTYSKRHQPARGGLFVNGMEQPHKKIEIVRSKIVLSNYSYDSATNKDVPVFWVATPKGWGNVVVRDCEIVLQGTCDFSAGAGTGSLIDVSVGGDETYVDIDGLIDDRSAAVSGDLTMVAAAKTAGSNNIRVHASRLTSKSLSATSVNRGVKLYSAGGTVARFDVFDSDFSLGTDSAALAIDLSAAADNGTKARTARNIYPTFSDQDAVVGASSALPSARVVADGAGLTYTIASGTVTQIAGTTVDGISPAIGDRILVLGAPASTGVGALSTTQPGNGVYVVTNNTTNLTVVRSVDMSGSNSPWGTHIPVREGATFTGYTFYFDGTGVFTWGTTALVYDGYFSYADHMRLSSTQTVGGTKTFTPGLKIGNTDTTVTRLSAGQLGVESNPLATKVAVPGSATATGVLGQWAADASFYYVCTATNTWRRVAIATW